MNTPGRQRPIGLLLHLLLFSVPCALAGALITLVLLLAWLSRQPSEVFLIAAASWALMSVWSAYAAPMLANTWRTAGAKGLCSKAAWLEALPIVSAVQAASVATMLFAAIGWDPGLLLVMPFLIVLGAPWASLSMHLRWLAKLEK